MIASIVPRIVLLFAQRAVLAIGTGLLSGVVIGAGGVAAGLIPVGGSHVAPTVALLSCPGSGPELTRIAAGQTLLVTARSRDGLWLQVYVGSLVQRVRHRASTPSTAVA